ncbi:LysR substrate-binding domain-containing protein [Amycolatopsis carbonis]|uniref:LysR substrate-binding domain-containing protein n=1 Tax=Amycolatopsis carbonis TaxID=715471 RepID=A0A9Y2MSJ3_9PSEU|nr:LysR substrate-binding domain-containing protein [Amycolatopsis sp. 2-15]WIX75953.1 LysR substrate-binding domain-containing protein [Amycolatopsis sp. 2-15]
MEYRHVLAFLAIADELHFGRAALRLHLTQPSLSQQLQRLECTLGVELVARTTHEVHLTRAGQAFEVEARELVRLVEQAGRPARKAAAGRSGTIRVGYNFPAAQHVLPSVMEKMQADRPDVAVVLEEKRTGPQLQALERGALDVALVYGRPATAKFRYRRLMRLSLVAVVRQRHKWAGRPGVPFAELAGQPCVLFERELCPAMYDAIVRAADEAGIGLDVVHEIDHPATTEILVTARSLVGFASISRAMLAGAVAGGARTVAVPLYDPVPAVDLYAVWRDDQDDRLRDSFLECLDAAGPFSSPPAHKSIRS